MLGIREERVTIVTENKRAGTSCGVRDNTFTSMASLLFVISCDFILVGCIIIPECEFINLYFVILCNFWEFSMAARESRASLFLDYAEFSEYRIYCFISLLW